MSNKETMFNNELKEGVKRKMLNYDINKTNKELKDIDNDDILKDNNSRIIINNYKPNYNTTNSNNKYGDYNYNNSLDLDNCKYIPLNNEIDNNSNYRLINNKKQISEEDIKNSKLYKELEDKYINKVKEYDTLKENKENKIQILKEENKELKDKNTKLKNKHNILCDKITSLFEQVLKYNINKYLDKEYSDILLSVTKILSFLNNIDNNLIENNKDGE